MKLSILTRVISVDYTVPNGYICNLCYNSVQCAVNVILSSSGTMQKVFMFKAEIVYCILFLSAEVLSYLLWV